MKFHNKILYNLLKKLVRFSAKVKDKIEQEEYPETYKMIKGAENAKYNMLKNYSEAIERKYKKTGSLF